MVRLEDEVPLPPAPRYDALLCWPVEFVETPYYDVPELHVTLAYFKDVRTYYDLEQEPVGIIPKQDFLAAARGIGNQYRLAEITGPDAFGPDRDIPVLKVKCANHVDDFLLQARYQLKNGLNSMRIGMPADDFGYSPHVTVPLHLLIRPPARVLLRPLELWYMDDEPEVVG